MAYDSSSIRGTCSELCDCSNDSIECVSCKLFEADASISEISACKSSVVVVYDFGQGLVIVRLKQRPEHVISTFHLNSGQSSLFRVINCLIIIIAVDVFTIV